MVVFLAVAMEFGQIFEYVSGLGGLEEWDMGVRVGGLWLWLELLVVGGFHILSGMPCRSNWLPDSFGFLCREEWWVVICVVKGVFGFVWCCELVGLECVGLGPDLLRFQCSK